MPKYKVWITRIAYSSAEFEVEAEHSVLAELKALEEAYNHIWSTGSSDYEIEQVEEVE